MARPCFAMPASLTSKGIVSKRKDSAYCSGRSPAQDEEPDCTSGQARGGRGLGQMTRTNSLPGERSGENRPPKGKGGPRFGSIDKGWCCHERGLNYLTGIDTAKPRPSQATASPSMRQDRALSPDAASRIDGKRPVQSFPFRVVVGQKQLSVLQMRVRALRSSALA